MKITIVCDVLGEKNNGTVIAAWNLIDSLKKRGHEILVVCPEKGSCGTHSKDGFAANEPGFVYMPLINFYIFNGYVRKNGVALAHVQKKRLQEAVERADIVHVMLPFFLGHAAIRMAVKRGIPVTAGFHCQAENLTNHVFLMNADVVNRAFYRFFYRHAFRYCDAVHYPTEFICNVFEDIAGPTNHYIISNGVNKSFIHKENAKRPPQWEDRFVIVFSGRYSKEKSHEVLIEAAARSRYKDSLQLVFAGDGPLREHLMKLSQKLPNKPYFRFFTREQLVNVLNAADLYVHPAEIEIEAISCLEAIACGLVPVIADSPRSATRFFALEEKNLFHFNDPDDLAAKIDYWYEHGEEKELCSRRYQGYAKEFDFDTCMDRMEQMLLETAGKGRRSGGEV